MAKKPRSKIGQLMSRVRSGKITRSDKVTLRRLAAKARRVRLKK